MTLAGNTMNKPVGKLRYSYFDFTRVSISKGLIMNCFSLFKPMRAYQQNLSSLFLAFVKNADVRNDILKWIGDCLVENRGNIIYLINNI
jgi:hypothetical protein